jgi:methionine-R-sulfoxide reductase
MSECHERAATLRAARLPDDCYCRFRRLPFVGTKAGERRSEAADPYKNRPIRCGRRSDRSGRGRRHPEIRQRVDERTAGRFLLGHTPERYGVCRHWRLRQVLSYDRFYRDGIYRCICCGTAVFDSKAKYASGTGWPSFTEPIAKENVVEAPSDYFGIRETEVKCARCDAHLGHVFDDGPPPGNLRYCINSVALRFRALNLT